MGGSAACQGDTFFVGNGRYAVDLIEAGYANVERAIFRANELAHVSVSGAGCFVELGAANTSGATVAAFIERFGGKIFHRGDTAEVTELVKWDLATVTQITNKSTSVTLHAQKGQIVMHPESWGTGQIRTFTLSNNIIKKGDTVTVSLQSGVAGAMFYVDGVDNGSCRINAWNRAAGTESVAYTLNFAVN
jgi:hypothetical protein